MTRILLSIKRQVTPGRDEINIKHFRDHDGEHIPIIANRFLNSGKHLKKSVELSLQALGDKWATLMDTLEAPLLGLRLLNGCDCGGHYPTEDSNIPQVVRCETVGISATIQAQLAPGEPWLRTVFGSRPDRRLNPLPHITFVKVCDA